MSYEQTISDVSRAVEVAGIATLVAGGLYALSAFGVRVTRGRSADSYEELRRSLGRSILLGLEILVAADIIRTIAITPTFTSVGVLGLIVVVRTFLSFSLEAELDGQWPWRKAQERQTARRSGRRDLVEIVGSGHPQLDRNCFAAATEARPGRIRRRCKLPVTATARPRLHVL